MSIRWSLRIRSLSELDDARAAGFERVQLPVEAVMAWDDAGFQAERDRLVATGVSFEVFEAPLPKNVQVTEQGFNTYLWTEYLNTAVRRISELGCRTLVWGDGRARLLPVEGDISTSKEHFYQFMFILCGIAEQFGITVCLEPLGARRTNFLNTLDEMDACIALIGKHNLSMMVSPRDLVELHADLTELSKYRQKIAHIHVENPEVPGSSSPPRSSDRFDYMAFFKALGTIDYAGVISLPSGSRKDTLAYCRQLWASAEADV